MNAIVDVFQNNFLACMTHTNNFFFILLIFISYRKFEKMYWKIFMIMMIDDDDDNYIFIYFCIKAMLGGSATISSYFKYV